MTMVLVRRSPRSVTTRMICRSGSSGSGSYSTRSTVVSRAGWEPLSVMSREGLVSGDRLAVERIESALHGGGDAREDGRLGEGVGARLGAPQLLHKVQELARVVGVERHDELLIVDSE